MGNAPEEVMKVPQRGCEELHTYKSSPLLKPEDQPHERRPAWFLRDYAFRCEHVAKDQTGNLNCTAVNGSVVLCSPEICVKLRQRRGER